MRKRILFESLLAISVILLLFAMYLMVSGFAFMQDETKATVQWDAPGNDTIYYIVADNDGTLRALLDGHIYGIASNGSIQWDMAIPDLWWIGSKYTSPSVALDNGTLYVYLHANVTMAAIERRMPYQYAGEYSTDTDDYNRRLMDAYAGTEFARSLDERVLAIASNGSILWNLPLSTELYAADIQVRNGTVYVYHGFNETAIDPVGNVLWDIGSVGAMPAVDEAGYVYAVEPIGYVGSPDRRALSGIIDAYYPNGTLYWRHDIGEQSYVQDIRGQRASLPLYDHDMLYMPLANGIASLNRNGSDRWAKHYNVSTLFFTLMPFDSAGNLYLRCYPGQGPVAIQGEPAYASDLSDNPTEGSYISILSPDGKEIAATPDQGPYKDANDGIAYRIEPVPPARARAIGELDAIRLTAYDLKGGKTLWSYNFTPADTGMTMLNESNYKGLMWPRDIHSAQTFNDMNKYANASYKPYSVSGDSDVRLLFGKSLTYIHFWAYSYDQPAIFNQSRIEYSGGLYAFDKDGKLRWSRPVDSILSSMYEKGGTIYYSTGSGKLSAAHIDIMTGLALVAALYVFIRFIVVGAISRARGAINTNENRNTVFKYILDHPGSTMYEIARALNINKGTVRYHLFILGVNHRVASQKADKKFVRYFPNSNTYTKDEQTIMSLMRREPIRKVLETLAKKPGLSNIQLSKELSLPESAMSKHMKELYVKGIVMKQPMPGGTLAYDIRDEYKGHVLKAMERMQGE